MGTGVGKEKVCVIEDLICSFRLCTHITARPVFSVSL